MALVIQIPKPNYYPRMTRLAQRFPTLDRADGIEPFDASRLDAWACSGAPCHGARWAARFLLAVWSGRHSALKHTRKLKEDGEVVAHLFRAETPWGCGVFDVVSAMGTWDDEHRAAFLAWAKDPWWP